MSISAVQGVETLVIENNVLEVHSMYKKKQIILTMFYMANLDVCGN